MAVLNLDRSERDRLVAGYVGTRAAWLAAVKAKSLPAAELEAMKREFRRLKTAYFSTLPRLPISRCPYSGEPLVRAFDPWDLKGFWWQEGNLEDTPEPDPGPHFRMLSGALGFAGRPAEAGGEEAAHVGPEVPFVIPRILAMPTMVAVVSRITLACGYQAYPIAYFSRQVPLPGTLGMPWRRTAYNWQDGNGQPCFSYPMDPWDFDLERWLQQGKLLWIDPDDETLTLRRHGEQRCPYLELPGRRMRQIVQGHEVRYEPPPDNEVIDPFNE